MGRVKSLPHTVRNRSSTRLAPGRILKPRLDRAGYVDVSLSNGSSVAHGKVHRLVAAAFLGPPPTPDAHVNHIDFKKANNSVANLEWCSPTENMRHAVTGGRMRATVSAKRAKKLTPEIVLQIRAAKEGSIELGRRYSISPRTVRRVLAREIWASV